MINLAIRNYCLFKRSNNFEIRMEDNFVLNNLFLFTINGYNINNYTEHFKFGNQNKFNFINA